MSTPSDASYLPMSDWMARSMIGSGCAYCINMPWEDARAGGESAQRLSGLDAWREASTFGHYYAALAINEMPESERQT